MKHLCKAIIIGFFLIWIFGSCSLSDDLMINSRIDNFISDLNEDPDIPPGREDMWMNFHPNLSVYNNIQASAAYFELTELSYDQYSPFSLSFRSAVTDIGGGQKQVTGTMGRSGPLSNGVTFVMLKSGADWYIREFYLNPGYELKNIGSTDSIQIK